MISMTVNGRRQEFGGDGTMPLLWYLRHELGLTGTKFACGVSACGACTVHLDGQAVRACVTSVSARYFVVTSSAACGAPERSCGARETLAG